MGEKRNALLALLLSCGCDLTARMSPCHGGRPGAIPGSRTNFIIGCASARSRVPKTQLTRGSTEAACQRQNPRTEIRRPKQARSSKPKKILRPCFGIMVSDFIWPSPRVGLSCVVLFSDFGFRTFAWGRGRQAMHLPCKQAYVGALPTGSTILTAGRIRFRRAS